MLCVFAPNLDEGPGKDLRVRAGNLVYWSLMVPLVMMSQ